MKKVKRSLIISLIIIFAINIKIVEGIQNSVSARTRSNSPINVAVFLLDFTDDLISDIREKLEEIQKQNEDKVKYTFYDGKSDQTVQNEQIDEVLNKGVDLILLNIVNRSDAQSVINKIKTTNIPVILFNREPLTPIPIQSYNRAFYIGTDPKQAGELQGQMLVDTWNDSREFIDKNRDKVMQYIMLEGESDNTEAIERTKHSVSKVEKSGIKVQQIAIEICDWKEDLAYNATQKLFSKYGTQIEVIIANDDTMAIGAIKALQEAGYNNGDKSKTIPVVGVDITPEAKEFIEKGYMLGSVLQSPMDYAEALYICGMNIVNRRNPVEGTKYQLDAMKTAIRIPHTEVFYKNIYLSE
ncbi:galactose ABC transporter substrate-binding protein [Clostridium sp. SHJSY1]|uniref:galactose ABC transporter substrate-binding protein n=1 Tax=Clostridium sp. SHJSY1 TaxID=2942483 RepID=UPI0028747823|nr:galactose ABC transporter substrate-binding protein [Clostridium sp. SHJSY1]MDS0525708.1 galactose ABC transporter substrate-binding protein [Clostridium sp. SHJSY1]